MTAQENFPSHHRGGQGIKCHKVTEKTGKLMAIKAVNEEDSVMMITTEGILIRIPCATISKQGRITAGVKLMNLAEDVAVAGVAVVRAGTDDEEANPENGDGSENLPEATEQELPEATEQETPEETEQDIPEETGQELPDEEVPDEE